MSWRERDYHRSMSFDLSRVLREWQPPWGVIGIVALHVVLETFFTQVPGAAAWAERHATLSDSSSSPLAILLHPWAATPGLSFFFTLLAVGGLGAQLEGRLGTVRILLLYLFGNLAAGVGFFALTRFAPHATFVALTAPIGGLAAWLAATWRSMRDETIVVFGKFIPVSQFTSLLAFGFVVLLLVASKQNPMGWVVALAMGALIGAARLDSSRVRWPRRSRARRVVTDEQFDEEFFADLDVRSCPPQVEIDDILAKISANGIQSLTPQERDRLESARREMIRRSH